QAGEGSPARVCAYAQRVRHRRGPLPSRPDRELPAGGRFCGHSRGAASVHGRFGQNRSGKEALKAFLPKNSYLLSMQTWVIILSFTVEKGKSSLEPRWGRSFRLLSYVTGM